MAAGQRLIERDGLEALTMRAVAAELDTAATSLYRHVADRDELLLGILERLAEGMPVTVPGRTARARLRRRLVAAHDYLAEHIWVLHILIGGEMVAETAFRFVDACLADFIDAGLGPIRAMNAFNACWNLTLGELLASHPLHPPRQPNQRQQAVAHIDSDRLPALARISAVLPPPDRRVDDFPRVMDILLAGLLPVAKSSGHR